MPVSIQAFHPRDSVRDTAKIFLRISSCKPDILPTHPASSALLPLPPRAFLSPASAYAQREWTGSAGLDLWASGASPILPPGQMPEETTLAAVPGHLSLDFPLNRYVPLDHPILRPNTARTIEAMARRRVV